MGQDDERGVGPGEGGSAVGQLVAEVGHDANHAAEGEVGEPQEVRSGHRDRDGHAGPRGQWATQASGSVTSFATCVGSRPEITSVSVTFSSTDRRLARTATHTCWRCSAAPS